MIGRLKYIFACLKYCKHFQIRGFLGRGSKIIIDKDHSDISLGGRLYLGDYSKVVVRGGARLLIDDNFATNENVKIIVRKSVSIGKKVSVGPNVVITDNNHDYRSSDYRQNFKCRPVIIGDNVWIAANCVILPGTTIGQGSVIAAGTVVSGSVPENSLVFNGWERSLVFKPILKK